MVHGFPWGVLQSPAFQSTAFLDPERVKTLFPLQPQLWRQLWGFMCILGWVGLGLVGSSSCALCQVPTPNWPHRTDKELTTYLLGCLPGDLNYHFRTSALAFNLSPAMCWLEMYSSCPCWVQSTQDYKSLSNHHLSTPWLIKPYQPRVKPSTRHDMCHHVWKLSTSGRHWSTALVLLSRMVKDPTHRQHHAATGTGLTWADTSWVSLS